MALSQDKVIQQFIEKHGNKYGYSLVEYKNAKTKVDIICKEHGVFSQLPNNHKKGQGCPKCGDKKSANAKIGKIRNDIIPMSQDKVIQQFIEKHGDRYDYSLVEYKNTKTKVDIICKEHGVFSQTPNNHKLGKGCIKCKNKTVTTENLIQRLLKIFQNNEYDYINTKYISSKDKIQVKCNKCNDDFYIIPHQHLRGSGCPICNTGHELHDRNFYKDKRTTLYYLKVDDAYKIGVTMYDIKTRYRNDKNVNITILKEWVFEDGAIAHDYEQLIIKYYKQYKYYGKPILEGGNTELFEENILPLFEDKIILE